MWTAGYSCESIEIVPEGARDNSTKIDSRIEQFQDFRFIRFEFFLSFCKNDNQSHLIYGIIMVITPFWTRLIVSGQLPRTSEDLFYFVTSRMPYLCGFWNFAIN